MAKKQQAKPAAAAKPAAKAVQKAQKAEVKAGKKKPVAKVKTVAACLTSQRTSAFRRKISRLTAATRSRHELVEKKVRRASRLLPFIERIAALAHLPMVLYRSSHPATKTRATRRTSRSPRRSSTARRCAMQRLPDVCLRGRRHLRAAVIAASLVAGYQHIWANTEPSTLRQRHDCRRYATSPPF
jgi:hypothetical protein